MTDVEMALLTNGREVPKSCVDALDEFESRWPGASFHMARTGLAWTAVNALPFKIETRVRYFYNQDAVDGVPDHIITFNDSAMGFTPDDAADYLWMMNNCIAWVEERKVYKTDWEPIGEDEDDEDK